MRRSDKIEWLLRIVVFGFALAVGIIGALNIGLSSKDYAALLLFVLGFRSPLQFHDISLLRGESFECFKPECIHSLPYILGAIACKCPANAARSLFLSF
jgi:hypothetical protein